MIRRTFSNKISLWSTTVLMIILVYICTPCLAAEKVVSKPESKSAQNKTQFHDIQPQYGGVLRIIETVGPKTPFGWPSETVGESLIAAQPAIETLLRQYYDGHFEPILATGWKISSDKRSITLTLRKGVKFHDGTEFDAEAVKWNLEDRKAAKLAGTNGWSSIEVINPYTVRINLSDWDNAILSYFASSYTGAMVSPTAYKTKGIEGVRWHPVGTGPFEFVSFDRDVRTVYKKFPGYWQKGKPYLDGVEYIYIKDPMTQSSAIQTGEAHVLNVEAGKQAADLRTEGLEVFANPTGVLCLIPDSANADSPLSDKRVREAVDYAIDKEAIAKTRGYGFWSAAYQLPPVRTIAYDPNVRGRKYNPEKAKQLLAQANYPKGITVKIYPHFGAEREIVVAIQGYLAKVGITAELEFVDPGKFTDYRVKGWKNGFLYMPIGYRATFNQSISQYLSPAARDFPSLKKPSAIASLLKDSMSTTRVESAKIQKVLKVFNDDITVIPLHYTSRASVFHKNVHDTNHYKLAVWPQWTPEKAWLSK